MSVMWAMLINYTQTLQAVCFFAWLKGYESWWDPNLPDYWHVSPAWGSYTLTRKLTLILLGLMAMAKTMWLS